MKCQVKWIDCSGRPTPDDNDAVAMAVSSTGARFPICAHHAEYMRASLQKGKSHCDPNCTHTVRGGAYHAHITTWHLEAL